MIAWWCWIWVAMAAPLGVVEGLVLDGDRHGPIVGATVIAMADGEPAAQAITGADGYFSMRAPAGTWPLLVRLRSGAERTVGPVRIEEGASTEVLVSWLVAWPPVVTVEEPPARSAGSQDEVAAEWAEVRGRVVDQAGEPLAGARVYARGQQVEEVTDDAGQFTLSLPVGTHDLTVLRTGFATRTLAGVEVPPSGDEPVVLPMVPAGMSMETFTVTAPRIVGGAASLLEERRQSAGVTEVLGAEQMKKSGDSNAAAALRRVTGLTLVGGRFVFVRGLGGRYVATLLNNSLLPSPEPEVRAVPLDLFPTSVLESVTVQKTFSPDLTGEFAGGLLKVRTRSVPTSPLFQVAGSIGYRHGVTLTEAMSGHRGPTDGPGFGVGDRSLPDAIEAVGDAPIEGRGILNPDGLSEEDLEALGESMPNRWNLQPTRVLPNGSLQAAWGDSWKVPGDKGPRIGGMLSAYWSSRWNLDEAVRSVYSVSGGETQVLRETPYTELGHRVQLGGMGVLGAKWGDDHEIASTTLINRISDHTAGTYFQNDPTSDNDRRNIQSRWIEQQMLYEQLRGHHVLSKAYPAEIDWRYVFARASRLEPEWFDHTYARDNEQGYFAANTGTWNQISYGTLQDDVHEVGLDVTLPFLLSRPRPGEVKLGGLAMLRDREASLRRFVFNMRGTGLPVERPMGELAVPENIGPTQREDGGYLRFGENRVGTDSYAASQELFAGYAMAEVPVVTRLRVMAGARVEASKQVVSTFQLHSADDETIDSELNNVDALPASLLTVAIGPKAREEEMLLRFGYGRTVSRPEFRELAPVPYIDPRTGTIIFGNEDLRRGIIDNVDVRWEWYFRPGESVSVAGFYKRFIDPIERVALPIAGSNTSQTLQNAQGARNFGAEIDFRLGWEGLHPKLADMFIAGNAAWIDSRITVAEGSSIDTNPERALQGQSPWVVNAQIGYDNPDLGLSVALLYNVFGPRIIDVGQQGVPDTYEMPVHRLDLVAIVPMPKGLQFQLRANNLLDWPVVQTTGGRVAEELRNGFSVRMGLQWNR